MKNKLTEIVGQHVRLVNESDVDMTSGRIHIHAHGKLEGPDDDGEFYVRIGEDPHGHGCNGVSFTAANVSLENGCFKQPSGIWEITLRG